MTQATDVGYRMLPSNDIRKEQSEPFSPKHAFPGGDLAARQISSEVKTQSDQCDSLGPSTERILIGSLLQGPDESMEMSGEVDITHDIHNLGVVDQPLRRRDKHAAAQTTQLEAIYEMKSEQQSTRSVRSHSAEKQSQQKSVIDATEQDGVSSELAQGRASIIEVARNSLIEALEVKSKQRSASLSQEQNIQKQRGQTWVNNVFGYMGRKVQRKSHIQPSQPEKTRKSIFSSFLRKKPTEAQPFEVVEEQTPNPFLPSAEQREKDDLLEDSGEIQFEQIVDDLNNNHQDTRAHSFPINPEQQIRTVSQPFLRCSMPENLLSGFSTTDGSQLYAAQQLNANAAQRRVSQTSSNPFACASHESQNEFRPSQQTNGSIFKPQSSNASLEQQLPFIQQLQAQLRHPQPQPDHATKRTSSFQVANESQLVQMTYSQPMAFYPPQAQHFGVERSFSNPIQMSALAKEFTSELPFGKPGQRFSNQSNPFAPSGSDTHSRHSVPSATENSLERLKTEIENPGATLKNIAGHCSDSCRDQTLSRWIQLRLESTDNLGPFYAEIVKDELALFENKQSAMRSLMRDVFGNYVIQKMLEKPKHNFDLLRVIQMQILPLSLDQYGCRVLQRAIDVLSSQELASMVAKLEPSSYRLIFDTNGNHVIQKLIQKAPIEPLAFFLDLIDGRVCELSTNVNGCRVMQRLLERFENNQLRKLIDEIIVNLRELRTDLYGNYVVSHLMEFGITADKHKIIDESLDDLVEMAMHKFGSNVVEKCLLFAPSERKEQIVDRLVSVPLQGENTMADLMQSKFGNFVVQRVFTIADNDRREVLLHKIESCVKSGKVNIRRAPEKHIFGFLEQKYGIKFDLNQYPAQLAFQGTGGKDGEKRKSNVSNKGKQKKKLN